MTKSIAISIILVVALVVQAFGSFALAGSSRVKESLKATEEQRIESIAQYYEKMADVDVSIALLERDLDEAIAKNPGVKNSLTIKKAGLIAVGVGIGVLAVGGGVISGAARTADTFSKAQSFAIGKLLGIGGSLISLAGGAVAIAGHEGSIQLDDGQIQVIRGQLKLAKKQLAQLQAAVDQLMKVK
mgnify:CR=1 FL=1